MISGNSMPSTPTSMTHSSILLSSTNTVTSTTRNATQRLTPNEVKAVHYVMRLLHNHQRVLVQSVPGLIARAPDHLAQLIGDKREDLILFFKRHNAIFQLHVDGTVTVKGDAVRALLNKHETNNNTNTNTNTNTGSVQVNSLSSSSSISSSTSMQLSQVSSTSITAIGVVIRIFPKYGILNMDNNEQVFFDIQSCHFETFNDLTCVLNPGDTLNFNAILGPKEGRHIR
jgi:hypothetical protein